MPRKCTICIHKKKGAIDRGLIDNVPYRTLSKKYGITRQALIRHKKNGHIAKELIKADKKEQQSKAVSLYDSFEEIREKVNDVIKKAENAKHWPTVLQGLRELRELLKLKFQMESLRLESGAQVDPIALTLEIREFLNEHYPKAHKGLLKHLQERSEYYRARISQGK